MRRLDSVVLVLALMTLSGFVASVTAPSYRVSEESDIVRLSYPTTDMEEMIDLVRADEFRINRTKSVGLTLKVEQTFPEQLGARRTKLSGDALWFNIVVINNERRSFFGSTLYGRVIGPTGLVYAKLNETVTFAANSQFSQLVAFSIPRMATVGDWKAQFFVFLGPVVLEAQVSFWVVSEFWEVWSGILLRGWSTLGGGIMGVAMAALLKRRIYTPGNATVKGSKWGLAAYYAASAVITVPIVTYAIASYLLAAS